MKKIILPPEIQFEIFNFISKKCHTCYKKLKLSDLKLIIVSNKFYFCSQECYNFI